MLVKSLNAVGKSLAGAALAVVLLSAPSIAQEETFSAAHLDAARDAVIATRSIEGFDNILPDVAERTRTLFIRSNPAMSAEIDTVVNEVALELAAERPALDKLIYEVWARRFSEEELKQIATFYNTEAGSKLAKLGGQLSALSMGAAKQWSDALSQQMVAISRERLQQLSAQ
ncbi:MULTISPECIES: DUF2059 domain-containing protein [Pseudovibrio]|uniref:DUF2059 domain-containing protein n=1 Tax=Stappiaceae TaxID=2821832 RepID=UPI00236500FD|nr:MULTISPECIES: DUF2059 domain-containing protein [Pseudovibrio]MDD7908975.1 DUF2059 domain-containing protein [Pseudovibrio exalbescens]MDX5593704.1 DUF2059 domain-containing protein [Pseudovibrio sp. SPO723]